MYQSVISSQLSIIILSSVVSSQMIVGAVNMVSCVGNVQCMDNITVDWDTTKQVVLEVDFYNANPFDKNR